MKAIEILAESKKISEAPASMLGQIAKRAGAGVLGAIGLNTWAGQINDKADVGMFANRYYKEFMNYLKGRNRSPDRATFGDLKSFMTQNKIPSHNVPKNPAGVANKDMVDSIFKQTAQEFLGGKTPGGNGAVGVKQQQPGQAPGTQQQPAQQQARPAPAAAVPQRTAQQPSQSAPASSGVNSIMQQIAKMSPKDLSKIERAIQSAKAGAVPGKTPATPGKAPAATTPTTPAAPTATAAPAASPTGSAPSANPNMGALRGTSTPQTPADIRKTKQAAAAKSAQDQMAASTTTAPAAAQTPADIRQTKQAAAAKAAQGQMAPVSKLPADQPAIQAANIRQTKQAAAAKVIDNPVATVGTKRATNVGEPTFDKETGKPLPGQAINAVRKKAEYGSGALGAVRNRIKAKEPAVTAAPAAKTFTGRKKAVAV